MKAAVLHTFGEAPHFEEFAEPVLDEGEVLVQVLAAGLHPIVKTLAAGSHYGSTEALPMIPGIDGVGRLKDGRRVYLSGTRPPYGTMAQRAAVPGKMCLPLPESLDDITAVTGAAVRDRSSTGRSRIARTCSSVSRAISATSSRSSPTFPI